MTVLAAAAAVAGIYIVFWNLLDITVFSVSIAVVLYPLYLRCGRFMNRYLSAAIVTAFVMAAFLAAVFLSAGIISQNSGAIQEIGTSITTWIQDPSTEPGIFGFTVDRGQVGTWIAWAETYLIQYWNTLVSDTDLIAIRLALFVLALYATLLSGPRVWDWFTAHLPEGRRALAAALSAATVDTLYAIFIVHLGIVALTFVVSIPFFVILGYGHVLFYSFLCAACELVPVLGSSVMFILLGIYALSIGDIGAILFLFFFGYIGVSALPEIYVRPVLMGRRVRVRPVLMLVGFFGGILTIGMAGFVLGPVAIVLLFTGYRIRKEERSTAGRAPGTGTA